MIYREERTPLAEKIKYNKDFSWWEQCLWYEL